MNTPHRVTPAEFYDLVKEHVAAHYLAAESQVFTCKRCGSTIKCVTAFMSIHDAIWGDSCAGAGKVKRFAIPFCPKCEPPPAESGCLHV